ncbi:MAG: 3-oxoacid CoA-transferase subunit A [Firmicutes bacterium]|nr:3-oxoacid CoA-transferase subunit A [Alicyclobacillaceae bacterium]MCL6497863.1 3-oxoacid CoA-transferase subunit A [Bacillota bacterium]
MVNKIVADCDAAVADLKDGMTIMVGGFGDPGAPNQLLDAVRRRGIRDLVIIANGAGSEDIGLGGMMKDGLVRKLICSFPNYPQAWAFRERYLKGEVELELVPQGTLAERIRAGGAGLGGFYTPTAVGTDLAQGKEVRTINGRQYVFETALYADVALIKAAKGDRLGNLRYRYAMRNFNPLMASAAALVIAEVDEVVPVGSLPPDDVHTPGIFVDRVVLYQA